MLKIDGWFHVMRTNKISVRIFFPFVLDIFDIKPIPKEAHEFRDSGRKIQNETQ